MEIFWVAAIFFFTKKKVGAKDLFSKVLPYLLSTPPPPPPPPQKKMYFNLRMLLEKAIVAGVIIVPNLSLYYF